jgi:hypothetical protein
VKQRRQEKEARRHLQPLSHCFPLQVEQELENTQTQEATQDRTDEVAVAVVVVVECLEHRI